MTSSGLAALAIVALVITVPVLVFSGNTLIAFAVGMLDATLAWGVALFVIESTGSSTWRMGAQGERWTAEELAGLDDRWRTLHAIGIPFGDVDHVAIGPAGVYALETKWTSQAWRRQDLAKGGRLDRAADQVWENGRAVRSRLRGHFRAVPVSPVIVLWGNVEDGVVRPHGEVQILHGSELRSWLSSQPDVFDRETVTGAADGLSVYLGSLRDNIEEQSRFVEVGAEGVLRDVASGVTGGIVGVLLGSLALSQMDVLFAPALGAVVAIFPLGLAVRHYGQGLARLFGLGMALAGSGLVALVGAVFLTFWLT